MPFPHLTPAERWRLLLGEASQMALQQGLAENSGVTTAMDRALTWLYGRKPSSLNKPAGREAPRDDLERQGGLEESRLTVPEWINEIHTLFPKETIERLERDALERYGIDEVVTNPEVLKRATPNPALLAAVMRSKHLMNPVVLAMARELVAKVVKELIEKLSRDLQRAFSGVKTHYPLVAQGPSRLFAARETVHKNLKHFDPQSRRLVVRQPRFHTNHKRELFPWQIFILVDQSGSMLTSVIHAAVTASCLWRLPGVRTHLIAYDTQFIDLSDSLDDPVETLMNVQLGGGNDAHVAVNYAASLINAPKRSIVVIISDFYEFEQGYFLVREVAALVAQGTRVLGLAALDENANPDYDRDLAAKLVNAGAQVGAMTPGQLANWMAEQIK